MRRADIPTHQLLPLTGMRFFLALWVIVFHQSLPGGYLDLWMPALPNAAFALLRTGYVAVGVFFVLSGFILAYNYPLDKPWSRRQLAKFGIARFARIYPAYCVGLLVVSPFVISSFAKHRSNGIAKEIFAAALNWSLLQSWAPQTATSWNGPGWSLSVEACFYCTFPFVAVTLWRFSRLRYLILASGVFWLAALLAPLAALLWIPDFGNVPATSTLDHADLFWSRLVKFNPVLHLPQFCAGVICARVYLELRARDSWLVNRGYWLYGPGIILELLVISRADSLPYPFLHNGLLLPLHSMIILGLALGGGIVAQSLSLGPSVFLGGASYSMYIFHALVSAWMDHIAKRVFALTIGGLGIMILYLATVICVSSVFFKFVEEPANRFLKGWLNSRLVLTPKQVQCSRGTFSNALEANEMTSPTQPT